MPKIAFLADDETATLCARLTCVGLDQIQEKTILALPRRAVDPVRLPPAGGVSVVDLAEGVNAYDVERVLLPATRSGDNVVAALPLDRARDDALRLQFDAVIAVGGAPAPAARALRAARYEAAAPGDARSESRDSIPVWFLAGSDQSVLMTKARLSDSARLRLPFATRTLPMLLPRLTPRDREDLEAWRPDDAALGTAVLLAALALAIASDPSATRVEAADLAAMMAAREHPAERTLAERLRGLADVYGRVANGDDKARPERPRDRSRGRRPQLPTTASAMPAPDRMQAPRAARSHRP